MKIFIGYDQREPEAYRVASQSMLRRATIPVSITALRADRLAAAGLLRRPVDVRGGLYDIHSNAPCSTEFAISRFLVPILAQYGWALFVDCDVVFLGDIAELCGYMDESKAVMVVKHEHAPSHDTKMDGVPQTAYARKNWSSVMLFNCGHPANMRLSLQDVQERPGRDLHRFYWLHDSEIGELPAEWNWLVGCAPKPAVPRLAHFTLGGPFIDGWKPADQDEIWLAEYDWCRRWASDDLGAVSDVDALFADMGRWGSLK
jgi:hypothetical protein